MSEVVLLGTGTGDGWPNPFCRCASCEWARADPARVRGQSSALLDGTVLLDAGPDVPLAASRHGIPLDGVRLVLLTHAHPDHVAPHLVLWRHVARRAEPLVVAGPAQALAAYRDWIGPDDPVTLHPLVAGDRLDVAGYAVRALPAAHGDAYVGPGLLYDVTTPTGERLLYATDTGPLPDATIALATGRAYDLVVLEETFGDLAEHPDDHLDLRTFGPAVAALRRAGAVTDRTRVVATHLSHGNPPRPELARRLAAYGAEVHPDGARLPLGAARPKAVAPQRVLVLGGARSGKSAEAERRLAAEPEVTYVATGGPRPDDAEWAARVAAHQARRPAHWTTVVTTDLAGLLGVPGTLLVDCVTLWLAAVMDETGCWDGDDVSAKALAARVDELVEAWRTTPARVVAVSNEVGSGIVPETASGRRFRDELGTLNARLAAAADEVWLVVAGTAQWLR